MVRCIDAKGGEVHLRRADCFRHQGMLLCCIINSKQLDHRLMLAIQSQSSLGSLISFLSLFHAPVILSPSGLYPRHWSVLLFLDGKYSFEVRGMADQEGSPH